MTLEDLYKTDWIIFRGVGGSHAAGLANENSDVDIRGIYKQPTNDILAGRYIPQINDAKHDIIYYEIGRFIELLGEGNPNIMEILNLPHDCVQFTAPFFERYIKLYSDKFLTKHLKNTFSGYALGQVKKAKGKNKKINWERSQVERKDVLDFCYVLKEGEKSVPFKQWSTIFTEDQIGLAKVNNFNDIYSMYAVKNGGIVSKGERESNAVQTRSIPKDAAFLGWMSFALDAYSRHCKQYRQYQEWLHKRNNERHKVNLEHSKGYDSKNMATCFKLLLMAKDIALGLGIQPRRYERDFLLSIKAGNYNYEDLLKMASEQVKEVEELFSRSNLSEKVDQDFVEHLLLTIRLTS